MHDVVNGFVTSSNEIRKVFRDKLKLHDFCQTVLVFSDTM